MRKIRVKNKYLILIVLFALLTMGAVRHYGGDYLWSQADKAHREGDYVKALAYYDALIERYPHHPRRPEALYWSAELLPSFGTFAATFFPGGSTVQRKGLTTAELPAGALTRIQRYQLLKEEYPAHWAARNVEFKLADAYHAMGDPQAEELYRAALHNELASMREDAGLRLVQMYTSQGRLEEALEIIRFCQSELAAPLSIDTLIQLGDLLAVLGDPAGAREAYEQALSKSRSIKETFPPDVDEREKALFSVVAEYERRIAPRISSLEKPDSRVFIHGQVSLLGQPLPGVNVYARSAADRGLAFPSGLDSPGLWVTDAEGRFSGFLPPGEYEFGISLNFHQAELVEGTHLQILGGRQQLQPDVEPLDVQFRFVDTVKLQMPERGSVYAGGPVEMAWEAYPGAAEYQVWFGVVSLGLRGPRSASVPVGNTTETRFAFEPRSAIPFGTVGIDSQGVEPGSLVVRPEGFDRLRFSVLALDAAGQVLSSSTGLHFGDELLPGELAVQEGLRTEAEELLFQRRYDEAVALLEATLEENPEDLDTLWLLARIYYAGTYGQEENAWDFGQFAHRDVAKSLELLERIQKLQPGSEVEEALWIVRAAR